MSFIAASRLFASPALTGISRVRSPWAMQASAALAASGSPPSGRVTVSAPAHLSADAIRAFAIGKLGWIRVQQGKLRTQAREAPPEYLDRESHNVWGRRVLIKLAEVDAAPSVKLRQSSLLLTVRPGTDVVAREAIVASWYRQVLKAEAVPLIAAWKPRLSVTMNRLFVQQMKPK